MRQLHFLRVSIKTMFSEFSGIDRLVKVIDAAKAVICCSCYEIEGEYLNLYKKQVFEIAYGT